MEVKKCLTKPKSYNIVQVTKENQKEIEEWTDGKFFKLPSGYYRLQTPEGIKVINFGDYIYNSDNSPRDFFLCLESEFKSEFYYE